MLPTKDRKKRKVKKEKKNRTRQDKHLRDHELDSAGTNRLCWSSKAAKAVETVFPGCDDPLMRNM